MIEQPLREDNVIDLKQRNFRNNKHSIKYCITEYGICLNNKINSVNLPNRVYLALERCQG